MTGRTTKLGLAAGVAFALAGPVHAADEAARLEQLEKLVQAQAAQLDGMQQTLDEQQREVGALKQALLEERLGSVRGMGGESTAPPVALGSVTLSAAALPTAAAGQVSAGTAPATTAQAGAVATAAQDTPERVGQAPEEATRPQVAQIFQQPGVLTPAGRFVLEPSVQLGYSSTERVALVGYTVIPAILIGLIDVRQVKTTTTTAILAARYGVTNRLELEARVPYVHINSDTVSREIFTGSAQDKVFNASGKGLGDVEVTGRWQINQGGIDKPFYVGWLRYKSRTGKDPFEVVTDCVTRCVANATGTGLPLELPTGSGFEALQAGVTWLFASDPVVFFGSLSYLHNFERSGVSRTVLTGAPEPNPQTTTEPIGDIKAGDIVGFNLGMGLALNEKAAISIGYDHSLIGRTESNGEVLPGAVRVQLGTLLLGGSYRFNNRVSLNVSLGVGVTRDTPDTTLMVRVPIAF